MNLLSLCKDTRNISSPKVNLAMSAESLLRNFKMIVRNPPKSEWPTHTLTNGDYMYAVLALCMQGKIKWLIFELQFLELLSSKKSTKYPSQM